MGHNEKSKILIVDDIEEYLHSLRNALGREKEDLDGKKKTGKHLFHCRE